GLQRRELAKRPCHTLTHQRHDGRDPEEQQRQGHERWQPASRAQRAEEDQLRAGSIDFDWKETDKGNERRERDRGQAKQLAGSIGSKESETDAEEAGKQDEVREVRKVEDIGSTPSNEGELQETLQ